MNRLVIFFFLSELWLFIFRLKSPGNTISFISVSTVRPIESSVFEKR